MAARRKSSRAKGARNRKSKSTGAGGSCTDKLGIRPVRGTDDFELVHPKCALERRDDIGEVRSMIDSGEVEIARDELRWLLDGCGDFLDVHKLLGELAWMDGDIPLARAHFGYAYQIGLAAVPRGGLSGPLRYERPANQAFFESCKALVACLRQLNRRRTAQEVVEQILRLDPTDPLGFAGMLADFDDSRPPEK